MASSSSLYRKYRSQSFDELVGQEPVVRTLKNAIASNRVAHAYLFTGPRGVGKTSAARLLARAANCLSESAEKPCNTCANCIAATRDIATDLIEIDAASNTGVDNIRELIERANFAPSIWSRKFYIIDEVHMLSISAFNALLKTLEEPPPHTCFILATTEVHKVPATVASRCQRFDFRRIPLAAMLPRLRFISDQEEIAIDAAALELVARQATGSLRDALSLLDQLRVFADGRITLKTVQDVLGAGGSEEVAALVDDLLDGDLAAGLKRINSALEEGLDLRQLNRQVVEHLRDLLVVKSGAGQGDGSFLDVTSEMKTRLEAQALRVQLAELLRWLGVFSEADATLRLTVYGQLPLEMAFVACTLPPQAGLSASLPPSEAVVSAPKEAYPPSRPQIAEPRPAARPGSPGPEVEVARSKTTERRPVLVNGHGDSDPAAKADQPTEPASVASEATEPPAEVIPVLSDTRAAAAGSGDLEQLELGWADVVEQIRARNPKMAIVYANSELVRPVVVSDGVCTLAFRDAIYVQRSMVNDARSPNRDIVEAALSKVLGRSTRIECITMKQFESGSWSDDPRPARPGGRSGSERSTAPVRETPSPYKSSRGKAAMNIFGIEKFDD